MLPDELESVAARHVPGDGDIDIHRLSVGLVNETYRVMRDGRAYALRVAGPNPHRLGLDRAWEARVLERAVTGGLAPVLEYCDPQRGILISRWAQGRSWSPAEVRWRPGLARAAELARRVHALPMPLPARLMTPMQWIDYYSAGASNSGRGTPAFAGLRAEAGERLAALEALPAADPVLCHSDLHTLNLVDRGNSLVLLDWEYAHAADPFWDLAGWSANNDLEEELRHDLLASYVGRPPKPAESQRLQHLGWLYDYVCVLWCDLYMTLHGDALQGPLAARVQKLNARLFATASSRAD